LDTDGAIKGAINPVLTPEVGGAESPSLARGDDNFGLVFNSQGDGKRVVFRTLSSDLERLGELVTLSEAGAAGGLIQASADRYVVTWGEYTDVPVDAIWGTLLSQADGSTLRPPTILTQPA